MKTFVATVAIALVSLTALTAFADGGNEQEPVWSEQQAPDLAAMT